MASQRKHVRFESRTLVKHSISRPQMLSQLSESEPNAADNNGEGDVHRCIPASLPVSFTFPMSERDYRSASGDISAGEYQPLSSYQSSQFPVMAIQSSTTKALSPEDYFLENSNSAAAINKRGDNVHVRKMSLKEFTGLEGKPTYESRKISLKDFNGLEDNVFPSRPLSIIVETPPASKGCSKAPRSSLISEYSSRRRSLVPSHQADIDCMDISSLESKGEDINFDNINQRIDKMRQNLADTMNSLPNQSPRKKTPVETEEIELLSESRRLAGACKAMIRSVCGGEDEEHWGPLVNEVVESAERVTNITETLVRKSNAIFHAQLMTANTDQMLRCLKETVESMRKLNGFDPSEDNSKILVSHSTSLSAAITQILHTVRGL